MTTYIVTETVFIDEVFAKGKLLAIKTHPYDAIEAIMKRSLKRYEKVKSHSSSCLRVFDRCEEPFTIFVEYGNICHKFTYAIVEIDDLFTQDKES